MKTTLTLITLMLAALSSAPAGKQFEPFLSSSPNIPGTFARLNWRFNFQTNHVVTTTNMTAEPVDGAFWMEWRVETNTSATLPKMMKFDIPTWVYTTNVCELRSLIVTNLYLGDYWPTKSLPEPTEGTETHYITSNLWMFVTWRGRTNSDRLESIPIRTETRRWKIEKNKVYLP